MSITTEHVDFGRQQCIVRVGTMSVRASRRAVIVVAALMVAAVVVAVITVGIGKYTVAPMDVLRVLVGADTSFNRVVVLEWRMPRMLMAVLIGAALGIAGAIFQALTRNALGSPDNQTAVFSGSARTSSVSTQAPTPGRWS